MMTTVLYGDRTTAVDAMPSGTQLWLSPGDLKSATGWDLKPEGLCKAQACVQTQSGWTNDAGDVDLAAFAAHMNQPMVQDTDNNVVAFGESSAARSDALMSLQAPDFELPDLDGNLHKLSDFRGKKVFLKSWGSY